MNDHVLICGTNWLGDTVMSMPSVSLFKDRFPGIRITVLARPHLASLWGMYGSVDDVMLIEGGMKGTLSAATAIRGSNIDRAFIFPNSFRSALVPFLGGVLERTGVGGQLRSWMLTDAQPALGQAHENEHQAWEYLRILGLNDYSGNIEPPGLNPGEEVCDSCRQKIGWNPDQKWIAILPGAARGPSKRWPSGHFVEVARDALRSHADGVLVLGSANECELCEKVVSEIGDSAVNLAGRTSLSEAVAFLQMTRVAITNDSGGMHMATAAGATVVAVFGLTDPGKTGPMGEGHRIVSMPGVEHSRDIPRDSDRARECLMAIRPERVIAEVREILDNSSQNPGK